MELLSPEELISTSRLPLLETYFKFASERQSMFLKRQKRWNGPLSEDPVLIEYRFTNTFRALDRVSQYLIRHVQRPFNLDLSNRDIIARTLLFKIFNKIETWEFLEEELGVIREKTLSDLKVERVLLGRKNAGKSIYSGAYIMPSPKRGRSTKHENHLILLQELFLNGTIEDLLQSASLEDLYRKLLKIDSFGQFLAFQYAIDLNYSKIFQFSESDFVIAGPGALDGLSKCFTEFVIKDAEQIILSIAAHQKQLFQYFGLNEVSIGTRQLQPIDCQNVFCELSKYSRISHPDTVGISGRTRIKQRYRPTLRSLDPIQLPEFWNLPEYSAETV